MIDDMVRQALMGSGIDLVLLVDVLHLPDLNVLGSGHLEFDKVLEDDADVFTEIFRVVFPQVNTI